MSRTISIRLTQELAEWLAETAARSGTSQGRIIRDQLEKSRAGAETQRFMRHAGCTRGPRDLSTRKGFARG